MLGRASRLIREQRESIKCEAEIGEGGGHAGLIVFCGDNDAHEILGRTDPIFDTAEEAVIAIEKAVEVVEASKPAASVVALEPEKEEKPVAKKKAGRKPRKESDHE